jgi:hypothetical protein
MCGCVLLLSFALLFRVLCRIAVIRGDGCLMLGAAVE